LEADLTSAQDLRRVIAYLQKEIRNKRRNIGVLKISNLLQLDRFKRPPSAMRNGLMS
jgi:hypothetical protein